jgi:hypothetical protein
MGRVTCLVCTLRLRELLRDRTCILCTQALPEVLVSADPNRRLGGARDGLFWDERAAVWCAHPHPQITRMSCISLACPRGVAVRCSPLWPRCCAPGQA